MLLNSLVTWAFVTNYQLCPVNHTNQLHPIKDYPLIILWYTNAHQTHSSQNQNSIIDITFTNQKIVPASMPTSMSMSLFRNIASKDQHNMRLGTFFSKGFQAPLFKTGNN